MNHVAHASEKTEANGRTKKASAFISAPPGMDTSAVRHMLEGRNITCFSPDELDLPGQNLVQILRVGMERADLVVGFVDGTTASSSVYYELGFAQALEKPTLVLATSNAPTSAWMASGIPYLRFDPSNPVGVEYGLTQLLKVPQQGTRTTATAIQRTRPIGQRADKYLADLRAGGDAITPNDFERIVSQAMIESGVMSVGTSEGKDRCVDLAVWSDDLHPWVGNPFFIELRRQLNGPDSVRKAVDHLVQESVGLGNSWGMLIYLRADSDVEAAIQAPTVLQISAEKFLESLRETGFGDLIRKMRNARVHGSR